MRYIKEKTIHQIEIQKSVFISLCIPLNQFDDVKCHLDQLKIEYPKANHYCYAAIFGEQGEQQIASDDGEPARTAGIPILEVLKHHHMTNVLAVVVRYFGGLKLGSGGLVRAYTKAIADNLKIIDFYTIRVVPTYQFVIPYTLLDRFEHHYKEKVTILDKNYQEHVTLTFILLENDLSIFDDIKHLIISMLPLAPKTLYVKEA